MDLICREVHFSCELTVFVISLKCTYQSFAFPWGTISYQEMQTSVVQRGRGVFNPCFKFKAHKLWVYRKSTFPDVMEFFDHTNCCSEKRIQRKEIYLWCWYTGPRDVLQFSTQVDLMDALKECIGEECCYSNVYKYWWSCAAFKAFKHYYRQTILFPFRNNSHCKCDSNLLIQSF